MQHPFCPPRLHSLPCPRPFPSSLSDPPSCWAFLSCFYQTCQVLGNCFSTLLFTHQDLCHVALHWKGFRGGVHEPVDQFYQSSFQRGDLKSQEAESPVPSAVLHRMRRRGVVPAEGSGGAVVGQDVKQTQDPANQICVQVYEPFILMLRALLSVIFSFLLLFPPV